MFSMIWGKCAIRNTYALAYLRGSVGVANAPVEVQGLERWKRQELTRGGIEDGKHRRKEERDAKTQTFSALLPQTHRID
jgi:hypothetical protein